MASNRMEEKTNKRNKEKVIESKSSFLCGKHSTTTSSSEMDTSIAKNADWIAKAFDKCKDNPNEWVHCEAIRVTGPEDSIGVDHSKNFSLTHHHSRSEPKDLSSDLSKLSTGSSVKNFTKSQIRKSKESGIQAKSKKLQSTTCMTSDRNK